MNIYLQNIKKNYESFTAVNSININIEKGSLHFLLGPSGCGKTTTLRLIAGLEQANSGKIYFDNKDVTNLPTEKRKIGMVFQNYALWPHMSVLKNIQYALKIQGYSKEDVKKRSYDVIEMCHLQEVITRFPSQISGGQQQRVALARALAIKPEILLLDEPLSNLDTKLRIEMRDNIRLIHQHTGITIVYVTHDQKEALAIGTHITILNRGKIIETNKPRELYKQPKTSFTAEFMGETNLIKAKVVENYTTTSKVKTDLGIFIIDKINLDINTNIYLNIRPECFKLSDPKATQENQFSAQIQDFSYNGDSELLKLKNKNYSHTLKATLFHNQKVLEKGRTYHFAISTQDITSIPIH
jgi:ABC-type Fe3+/spermidine/putrescine transport system ATPase subunit